MTSTMSGGGRPPAGSLQPPIRIEDRAGLIHALTEAAELEHGLLLQYLFAAFSMRRLPGTGLTIRQAELVREWEATILRVAHEEMAHLGTVSNLLTAVGGAPQFRRPNFPVPNRYFRSDDPTDGQPARFLEFTLTPFSTETVTRFVRFEAPAPPEAKDVRAAEPQLEFTTVGDLYGQIETAFVELDEASLFIGPEQSQDTDDWSLGLRLWNVVDTRSAITAIRSIVVEGEGTPAGGVDSHHQRFLRIQQELAQETATDPGFAPALPVVANPMTRAHFEAPGAALLDDPFTCRVSELFNAVYASMLLLLMQYYAFAGEGERQRAGLRATIRQMMSGVIRPLAEVLTALPAGPSFPGQHAGPSFELYTDLRLPANRGNAWTVVAERLAGEAVALGALAGDRGAPTRLAYLHENLRLVSASIQRWRRLEGA
jgi:Ferritin-like